MDNLVFLAISSLVLPSLERIQPSTWNSSLEISKLYDISDGPFPSCFPLFLCSFVEEIGPEVRSRICALTTIFPESLHLYCFFFLMFHLFSELLKNILFPLLFIMSIFKAVFCVLHFKIDTDPSL